VFIALSFILLIASFNIYVSLSMLAVDKQADLTILRAMGADDALMRRIFMAVGSFIAITGAIIGLGIGIAVCMAQQTYGIVGMGITNALVDAYPVTIDPNDLIAIALVIVIITLLSSIGPALKAMRIGTRVEV
jgi:lipoprotein-releasing system permease protein